MIVWANPLQPPNKLGGPGWEPGVLGGEAKVGEKPQID